jgi:hypothetical protein
MSLSRLATAYPKIPILASENWNLWMAEIKMLLIREKLWSVASGREKKSATRSADSGDWEEKAERAVATIFPFLDDTAKRLYGDEMDPVVLLEKLKKTYEIQGFSATFIVWKRLLGAKVEGSVQDFVAEVQGDAQILKAAKYTLDDGLIAAVLLAGLPEEYSPFITSVTQALRTNTVVLDTLISQILDESARVSIPEVADGLRNMALAAQKKGPGCWHCGLMSHKEANCWKKYPDKALGGQQKKKDDEEENLTL